MARRPDAERTRALIDGYRQGSTVYQMGGQFGIVRRTVDKILTHNGVRTKHLGLSRDEADQAAEIDGSGWSLARIGEHFGVTGATVHGDRASGMSGCEPRTAVLASTSRAKWSRQPLWHPQ
jgi:hypothetical protein